MGESKREYTEQNSTLRLHCKPAHVGDDKRAPKCAMMRGGLLAERLAREEGSGGVARVGRQELAPDLERARFLATARVAPTQLAMPRQWFVVLCAWCALQSAAVLGDDDGARELARSSAPCYAACIARCLDAQEKAGRQVGMLHLAVASSLLATQVDSRACSVACARFVDLHVLCRGRSRPDTCAATCDSMGAPGVDATLQSSSFVMNYATSDPRFTLLIALNISSRAKALLYEVTSGLNRSQRAIVASVVVMLRKK